MKRNRILASAVILALGSSGTALAGIATECSSEAARLTTDDILGVLQADIRPTRMRCVALPVSVLQKALSP